jgi:hypothetical protein
MTSSAACYCKEQEIALNADYDIFYLTGQPDQPVCHDTNTLSFTYGYIRRHHKDYILYICDAIWINGNKTSLSMHLLRDGDQLTINPGCQLTFHSDL